MPTSSDVTGGSGLDDTYQRDLDTTTAALEAGVTTLAPGAAVRVIDVWYDTLKNAERDDLHLIADVLGELREELQRDRLDGPAIGDLLLRLGEHTSNAAADADDQRLSPRLEHLGTLLTAAGAALGAEPVEAHHGTPAAERGSDVSPVAARISQTEKGLAPDPGDENPGRTTDRPQ